MPSEPLPIFCGHPDRPVDPVPELTGRKKKAKSKSSSVNAESTCTAVVSGNLFEQALEPPLTATAGQDAAVPPSPVVLECPIQAEGSKPGIETIGAATCAVVKTQTESLRQQDSAMACPANLHFCPHCGTPGDGAEFCASCGERRCSTCCE